MRTLDAIGNAAHNRGGISGVVTSGFFKLSIINHASSVYKRLPAMLNARKFHTLSHKKAIWLYPITREADLGTMSEPKSLEFYIRNASNTPKTLRNLGAFNASGIELIGLKSGETLRPDEWRLIKIMARVNGDALIDSKYELNFGDESVEFRVKGVRAVIFSYRPNYEYQENKTLKTDIFRAQNGRERRIAKNATPLKSINFTLSTKDIAANMGVKNMLSYSVKKLIYVPLWLSASSVLKELKNSVKIAVNTKFKEFKSGDFAIIWRNENDVTFFKIVNLGDDFITSDKALSAGVGDLVLPLIKATPKYSNSFDFINGEVGNFSLEFKELK